MLDLEWIIERVYGDEMEIVKLDEAICSEEGCFKKAVAWVGYMDEAASHNEQTFVCQEHFDYIETGVAELEKYGEQEDEDGEEDEWHPS